MWKPNGKSPGDNQIAMQQATIGSVWNILPYKNKENKHPCIFPIEIPARIILATTNEGDLVFDPFCGCGTTLVAAKILGRDYLGVEISKEYATISRNRLRRYFVGDEISASKERDRLNLNRYNNKEAA